MTEIIQICWHHTAIDRTLGQRSCGEDQIKGWHPTAIDQNLWQKVHTAKIYTNPTTCHTDLTINRWHHTATIMINPTARVREVERYATTKRWQESRRLNADNHTAKPAMRIPSYDDRHRPIQPIDLNQREANSTGE